ncbi:MAG: hypothetical protein ACRC41_08245 [Sarcina sp.]
MKKLFSKKVLFYIMAVLIFFAIFKYIKGKSFIDTFWEYTNNIKSINSEIIDLKQGDLKNINGYYMPVKYTEYIKYKENKYISKSEVEEENDIYIYDIKTGEESILEEIKEGNLVRDIKVSKEYVIWIESKDIIKSGKKVTSWELKLKENEGNTKILDFGEFQGVDNESYNINFPDSFELDKNHLVYRRYRLDVKTNNNITIEKNLIEIVYKNLTTMKEEILATSNDIERNIVYNPKIDDNKIIWEKIYKMADEESISNTEVYMYDIDKENIEKIYTANKILDIDLKNNNVVMLLENPDPNIVIYKIDDLSMVNILYKGSKAYKKISDNGDEFSILDVDFISDTNIIIKSSNLSNQYNNIIYNLQEETLLDITPAFVLGEEHGLKYTIDDEKLNIFVGTERFENQKDKNELNYYYKNYICDFN